MFSAGVRLACLRLQQSAGTRTIVVAMVTANFRFYGGLNDFLAPVRRQRAFDCGCARAATVKHMIEALGVPHTEVALVLIDGESCSLDTLLQEGDRVAAFPPFCSVDIGELARIEALPPGRPRFIADAHLGGLARMLRMAGFDTLYKNEVEDSEVAAVAEREDRIVLTRDRDLLKRRNVRHGCYVRALKAEEQLKEMVDRLALAPQFQPFSLCLHCNVPLLEVAKESVLDSLPPAVREGQSQFQTCTLCKRVFWKGSHWKRMCAVLAGVAGPASTARQD